MNDPWMYIVLLGLVCLISAYMLPKRDKASKEGMQPGLLKEIEETMDGFLAEVEEGNREFMKTVSQMKQEQEHLLGKLSDRVEELEMRSREQDKEIWQLAMQRLEQHEALQRIKEQTSQLLLKTQGTETVPAVAAHTGVQTEQANVNGVTPPSTMKDRYNELFDLHDGGKSVEYIAKKLGMNKGEVSLIIQLAKQEEREGVEK